MADVGSPLDYFARVFGNFEFSISGVFALNHAVAIIGMVTGIFLIGLALFIFRSGSKDLKNQAIGMILLIEGFMAATLAFYWIYPFSLDTLQTVVWLRAVSGITGLTRMMMMVALVSFFIESERAKRVRRVFQWKRIWILPTVSFLALLFPFISLGGLPGTLGDMVHIYCVEPLAQGVGNTVFGTDLGYDPVCPESFASVYPIVYISGSSGAALLPMVLITTLPLVFVAAFMVRLSRDAARVEDSGYNLQEIKALRTGFVVKVTFMLGGFTTLIGLSIAFGLSSPEMTLFNPETTNDRGVKIAAIGGPLMLLCHILSALFEGTIFTYAILKHEVMGIDERLRKGFTAAAFTGFGALSLLIASEAVETAIPGGGLVGGLIVGVPLIALRRPIFRVFSNLSAALMPEAHTMQELQYLEVFAAANADGIITSKERTMLNLQAKAFGINPDRQRHLEGFGEEAVD